MKQRRLTLAAAAMVAALTSSSQAGFYTDTVGDEFTGNAILDITSVEVTNNFSDVIFKINLNGNPVATDWGKYCIGIDTNPATGDIGANGNGWGRSISMNPNGMDFWVGTWVDGAMGANFYAYDGAFWNNIGGASVQKTTTNVTITLPIASLAKNYGDSFDFDIYTTGGGGGDPAIDSLANPAQTVSSWSTPYASSLVKTYTLVTPPDPSTNHVKFTVNMEIPIWEFDNTIGNGFNTNVDTVFVRGSFNGWGTVNPSSYQLFQVGGSTLFTNTVEVVQYINQSVDYKFEGVSFPGYESPVLLCGNNRTLKITGQNMNAPTNYWSDRKLSDPTNYLTFKVDMSLERMFGQFDPDLGQGVTMPGNFNGWNNSILPLSAGTDPDTNIYNVTLTYVHYPIGSCNVGAYKFFISGNGSARDGGWEDPIGTSGGNRNFSINSAVQTNAYYYNDEIPYFNVTSVQKLSPDATKINWQSFPSRGGNIPTGGIYQVEYRNSLNSGDWTSNGTVSSTTTSSTFTNTGLTGTSQQFYRVVLKGLVP
jgi:hypothetical protein